MLKADCLTGESAFLLYLSYTMEKFISWVTEKGIITDTVVKETEYAGYGLFTTTDVTDTAVHIPDDLLLTSLQVIQVDNTFSSTIFDYFSKKYSTDKQEELDTLVATHEKFVLCLFVIYCQLVETEYKPYIDILPTLDFFKQNHVLFNVDSIEGTSLEKSTRAKLSSLRRDYEELRKLEHTWISDIDFNTYVWADCVFWSRVVGIGESEQASQSKMALIPYFDFANHSNEHSNMRWQLLPDQQGLDLVTYEKVPKDTELLLSYGSKPNQELLFLHGFCIPNNPEPSCFTLSVAPFLDTENDPISIPKIQWLKCIRAKPTLKLFNTDQKERRSDLLDCGWTHESIAIMYLIVLDEDNGLTFSVDDEGDINGLQVADKEITNLDELENAVNQMKLLPVIKLRAVMLLLDALEFHYSVISQFDETSNEKPVAKQALIYRQEETRTLESGVQSLTELRDLLMTDPVVLSYLQSVEED